MESLGNVCHTCEQDIPVEFKKGMVEAEKQELQVKERALFEAQDSLKKDKEYNFEVLMNKKIIKNWEDTYNQGEHNTGTTNAPAL